MSIEYTQNARTPAPSQVQIRPPSVVLYTPKSVVSLATYMMFGSDGSNTSFSTADSWPSMWRHEAPPSVVSQSPLSPS